MLRKILEFLFLPFALLLRGAVAVLRSFKPAEPPQPEPRVDSKSSLAGASEKARVLAFLRGRAHGECDLELLRDVSTNLKIWAVTLDQAEVESLSRMAPSGALAVITGARAPDLSARARQRNAEQQPSIVNEFASALEISAAPRAAM